MALRIIIEMVEVKYLEQLEKVPYTLKYYCYSNFYSHLIMQWEMKIVKGVGFQPSRPSSLRSLFALHAETVLKPGPFRSKRLQAFPSTPFFPSQTKLTDG